MKVKYSAAITIRLAVIFAILPSYLGEYFVPFLNNLTYNLDIWSLWLNSNGDDRAFPYGLTMLIAYVPSLIFSQFLQLLTLDPMRALEIAVGLQMLVIEILLWRHLEKSKSMKKSLNVFLFSPLIIWVNYFLGLNDFFPSACLFFGSYLLLSHKYRSAGILIGIAIGMKFSLALVLPFLILFAWDNPRFQKRIWITAVVSTFVGVAMYLPGLYSAGFREMVFNNEESSKAFDFYLFLGDNKLLVLPLTYLLLLYWLWKAGRISLEVLIAFFGIALFLISAFSPASIGWMLWGLPLMFMNLSKQSKSRRNLVLIQVLFLSHNVFSGLEITTVFGVVSVPVLNPDASDVVFTLAIVLVTIWSYSSLKAAIQIGDCYKIAKAPLTVSIAGDSGTGKDTLAQALIGTFTSDSASVICGDDYHKYERGDDSWKNITHLNPASNYLDLWERDYNLAYRREYFEQREYNHDSGKFSQLKPRLRRDLLVSQGLHGLYSQLSNKSDVRIFLSMEHDLRVKLKLERDKKSRNHTYDSIVESIKKREEDYRMYVAPQAQFSDLHFHLFERENNLWLEITTQSNLAVNDFMEQLSTLTNVPVLEKTSLNSKIYEVHSGHTDQDALKKILQIHLSGYEQLFLAEPNFPDGVLGIMVVLTIIMAAKSRENYHD
jgi:uridine kinase